MADEEKLIADAFQQAFKKTAKLPPDLYLRMSHELKVDDNEPLKVNLTMKRGLVLDIEDDSLFRTFLTIGDIVLTINDKAACKPDFKLTEALKERKTITFSYIRLRNYAAEEPQFVEGERRDNYEYKVAVIYGLQRMHLGLAMEGLNNRVFITAIQPKSLGSMCAAVGDVILHVHGKRVCDTEKTMALISDELESKSHCKITLERAKTEEAKAQVTYAISKESRDPPVPTDCSAYMDKAILAMKGAEPKNILRPPSLTVAEAGSRVAFHERLSSENIIPSDVAEDTLIKTPARVPNAPPAAGGPPQSPSSNPPPSSEAAPEKAEVSVLKPVSMHEPEPAAGVRKETKKKGKGGSAKKAGEGGAPGVGTPSPSGSGGKSKESVGDRGTKSMMTPTSTMSTASKMTPSASPGRSFREWRKRLSTEIFFGRNRKKSGSGGTPEPAKNKKKKSKSNTASNETESNQ